MVCSLVSVSGGVGVSHLTVSLGLAMHRLYEKRMGSSNWTCRPLRSP